MKNGITRQPLGITLVLFSALLLFFWARHLWFPMAAESAVANTTPFGGAVNGWLEGYRYLEALLSVIFVLLTAIVITRLVSRNLVFPARTYIFLIFMVMAGYGLFIRSGNLPAVVAAYLIARACELFASSFRRSARFSDSFRGAFLLGLAPLLYAPSAIYILLLPIAMPVYMRGPRETVVAVAGLLLPTLAYSYVMWGLADPFMQYYKGLWESLMTPGSLAAFVDFGSAAGITRLAAMALIAAAAVMSLGTFVINAQRIRTRAFRIYIFIFFFLLVACAGLFMPCASVGDMPLLALPVSVVSAAYFSRYTGVASIVIYAASVCVTVVYNILLIL